MDMLPETPASGRQRSQRVVEKPGYSLFASRSIHWGILQTEFEKRFFAIPVQTDDVILFFKRCPPGPKRQGIDTVSGD